MSAQTSLNLPMGDTHNMSYKRKTFDCMQRDVSFATLITDSCSFPKSLTVSGGVSLRRERKIGISRKLEKMWKLWNIRKKFTNVHHLHIFPAQKKQRKQLFQIFFPQKKCATEFSISKTLLQPAFHQWKFSSSFFDCLVWWCQRWWWKKGEMKNEICE